MAIFLQYCQESYLEPKQKKSKVELFCKNSQQLLAASFFCKKSLTINVRLCSKMPLLPVKEKETNYLI